MRGSGWTSPPSLPTPSTRCVRPSRAKVRSLSSHCPLPKWGSMPIRSALIQVVENVLANASKYTAQGGHIDVTALPHGDEVQISISRQWDGHRRRASAACLRPLHSGRSIPRPVPRGTGDWADSVRRLVEMHGGTVEARSEGLGKRGAVHPIRLPLAARPRKDPAPEARHPTFATAPGADCRRQPGVGEDSGALACEDRKS